MVRWGEFAFRGSELPAADLKQCKRLESRRFPAAEVTACHSGLFSRPLAGSAQFCLLCCQPEPVPESLPARPPPLTQGRPCRLPVW